MTERPRFERIDKDAQQKFAETQKALAEGDEETLAELLGADAEAYVDDQMESARETRSNGVDTQDPEALQS